jgi:type I restriction enzyme M protein
MENLKTALSKAHQTIWGGGKRNPAEAFGEVAKIIFIKVADEKKTRKS